MSEEENNKSDSKEEQPKFNQQHYDRLIECSKKGAEGIKEWNEWTFQHPSSGICLQGANLENTYLQWAFFHGAYLQGAQLLGADLQDADFRGAHLHGVNFDNTKLQGAIFDNTNLQGVDFDGAKLQGAKFAFAELQGANLMQANLQGAVLWRANLKEVELWEAKLQGAQFVEAIVNEDTSFLECEIDENTDFRETALENVRINFGTKILLKYNIRRMNWEDWYAKHRLLQWPVKWFWLISDYGISTKRIMGWFFGLALAFACVYSLWPRFVMVNGGEDTIRNFVHALYFSVVTMTTLGFGDIAANPDSWVGQVVLMVQVILGYVLLGALVTRLAVLFTSDGPAGSFTPMDEETKDLLAKLREDRK